MRHAARKTKRTLAVVTLALASCRGPIQALTPTPEVVPLRFVSTNTTAPLLQSLAANYRQDNKLIAIVDQADFGLTPQQVLQTPSMGAMPDLAMTYVLTTYLDPKHNLWAAPIGQDGIAIITNRSLELDMLSASDLRDIFTGAVTRWSKYSDNPNSIIVVSPHANSATRQTFENLVLGQRHITLNALLALNNDAMLDLVATTPGAIGFISMSHISEQVNTVPISNLDSDNPIFPTRLSVANSTYPLHTPVLIVGPRPPIPGDGYYEFILWAQTEGQSVVQEHFVPLAMTN